MFNHLSLADAPAKLRRACVTSKPPRTSRAPSASACCQPARREPGFLSAAIVARSREQPPLHSWRSASQTGSAAIWCSRSDTRAGGRSEERRVGKEWRSRWAPDDGEKKRETKQVGEIIGK